MPPFTRELRKFVAPEFVFGVDARLLAGQYIKNWGVRRVLLASDAGVARAGWCDEIKTVLIEAGVEVFPFISISPNPRDHEVMAGADFYTQNGCDSIVAVGGGSVMDAAKGIGIVVSNKRNILDFEGVDRVAMPMPPLVCIPTTAGTSADVSQFAIINNTQDRVKIAIISKALVPDVALVDPVTLTTVDPYLGACTGMDALVHAIEAFVSNASSPFTDLHAQEGIRLLSTYLTRPLSQPPDLDQCTGLMLGSLEAGLAFSNASLGCVHALAHSLGGYLDLPHGECNALLLQQVVSFNFSSSMDRYHRIGEVLGCPLAGLGDREAREALCGHLGRMRTELGITGSLGGRGLKPSDLSTLAGHAIKDPCNATNPRPPTERDLEVILEQSL